LDAHHVEGPVDVAGFDVDGQAAQERPPNDDKDLERPVEDHYLHHQLHELLHTLLQALCRPLSWVHYQSLSSSLLTLQNILPPQLFHESIHLKQFHHHWS